MDSTIRKPITHLTQVRFTKPVLTILVLALQRTPVQNLMKIQQAAQVLTLGHTRTDRRTDVDSTKDILLFFFLLGKNACNVSHWCTDCVMFKLSERGRCV